MTLWDLASEHAMNQSPTLTKMVFDLDPDDCHGRPAESLWVEPVLTETSDKVGFVLQNSPFYARGVSYLDTARGKAGDGALEFDGVIARGGHSTYMILTLPVCPLFDAFWQRLKALGCSYESGSIKTGWGPRVLYSVDVPDTADIHGVHAVLNDGEKQTVWMFQEGHLGHKLDRR